MIQRFLRPHILLLFSIVFVNVCCENKETQIDLVSKDFLRLKNILENGSWSWDEKYCAKTRQTITIDIDKKQMTLILKNLVETNDKTRDTFVYNIKRAWKTGFRGRIINEDKVDKNKQTIEWDLFVVDENSFYWRRSDWSKNAASKPIVKCLTTSHESVND